MNYHFFRVAAAFFAGHEREATERFTAALLPLFKLRLQSESDCSKVN